MKIKQKCVTKTYSWCEKPVQWNVFVLGYSGSYWSQTEKALNIFARWITMTCVPVQRRCVTRVAKRFCLYCSDYKIDDEKHAILTGGTFTLKRIIFFGKMSSLLPNFSKMSPDDILSSVLCPRNAEIALCVSKYLGIITETRTKLDQGLSSDLLLTYCKT